MERMPLQAAGGRAQLKVTTMTVQKQRGRPRKSEDEKVKTKNITVDAELVGALNTIADRLEQQLGFRPTLSQTLRQLIRRSEGQS